MGPCVGPKVFAETALHQLGPPQNCGVFSERGSHIHTHVKSSSSGCFPSKSPSGSLRMSPLWLELEERGKLSSWIRPQI